MQKEDIEAFVEMINKSKTKQKGYVLLPKFNGFDLYEIDEDKLRLLLNMNKPIPQMPMITDIDKIKK